MTDWIEHTPTTDPYKGEWDASFLRMQQWPKWGNGERDVTERYIDGHVEYIGSGAYGLVFKAKRVGLPEFRNSVALKVFVAMPEGTTEKEWGSAILQEVRTLIFIREVAFEKLSHCERNVTCFVDNFKARLGPDIRRAVTDAFLPEAESAEEGERFIEENFPELNSDKVAFCLETELVQGTNMQEAMILGQNALSFAPEKNVRLLLTAARGLKFMHDCGLAHGDLKPGNLMLHNLDVENAMAAETVILDLGSACRVDPDASKPATPGSCKSFLTGTLAFMAPRLLRYVHTEDLSTIPAPRTLPFTLRAKFDVYALGLCFYDWGRGDPIPDETRVGEEPYFPRRADTPNRLIQSVLRDMLNPDDNKRPTIGTVVSLIEHGRQ
jgi:serine/threonine protein kinase